jgi:crotonobetainyl-CoA:carnitine CoA-transferase CaiB-like acyl-CoA transferase
MKPSLLSGMRVVDMTTVIFGPYCTQILADLGADVIKIEQDATGDASRNIGKSAKTPYMGPLHMRLNRGKRSVVWDLNIRPDAVERARLGYETVRKLKPDIIYVHCTGFDTRGPSSGLPAYDDIIQASSGAASLLPRVDGNPAPRFVPMAVADKVSGLHAAYALLAAVIHRLRTGEGQFVEVPMLESIASFNLLEHLYERTFDPPIGTTGYARQLDPTRQPLRTKDGYIVVAPYQDGRWLKFLELTGLSHVLEEPGLTTLMERRANADRLYRYMAQVLPEKTTDEWLALLAANNIPASRVNTIDDLLDDPQLEASGLFTTREHPTEGRYIEVGQPVRFSAAEKTSLRHAPTIGQHTEELNRELGLGGKG